MIKFWEYIKNIGALAGLLWVLMQGYNFISQKGFKLEAEIETSRFNLPNDFQYLIDSKKTNFFDLLKDSLNKSQDTSLVAWVDAFLSKSLIRSFDYPGLNYGFCSVVSISNTGNKEANNIQLLTGDNKIIFQFTDNTQSNIHGISSKVKVGVCCRVKKLRYYFGTVTSLIKK